MEFEENRSTGGMSVGAPRGQYCSSCFHYSLARDWAMRDVERASAEESCPCCGVGRDPAGVWVFPGLYADHSFGPLATDDERSAAAQERRCVPPTEGHSSGPVLDSQVFFTPQTRGRWVLVFLGVTVALEVLSVAALSSQRSLLNRGSAGIAMSEWQTSVGRVNQLATIELVLYLITAVAFFLWLHRCYLNVAGLPGRHLRFTPGWAVGYWFIPVLNIVRSKQILDELWRCSAPVEGADAERKPLTTLWLCALLVAAVASQVAATTGKTTIGDVKSVNELLLTTSLAHILAAILIYRLVRSVTTWQVRV